MIRRVALAAGCAIVSVSSKASAFCRTTTCNPNDPSEDCERDAEGCVTTGRPLHWRQACVAFSVHERGSPLRGISYAAAVQVVERAFAGWTQADCGGGAPSLAIAPTAEPAACDRPEYNAELGNANVWAFRDRDWPYSSRALALTTVTFDGETGEILNADVQINAGGAELTLSGEGGYDFASIAAHEAGHFVGLSHSSLQSSTMWYRTPADSTATRSLEPDDVAAVCAAYPPDRPRGVCDFEPRNGWAAQCSDAEAGCHAAQAGHGRTGRAALLAGLALFAARRRRTSCGGGCRRG